MELIEGIKAQSGVFFALLAFNLLIGILFYVFYKHKRSNNILFLFLLTLVIFIKLKDVHLGEIDVHKNLIPIITFPILLIALPFYELLFSYKLINYIYCIFLAIFFTLDLPFIKLFSNIIIPNYSTRIIFVAGIVNIMSLYLINSPNLKIRNLGRYLFFVTYISVLFSLAKWMIPVIFLSPFFYFWVNPFNSFRKLSIIRVISLFVVSLLLVYIFRDSIAQKIGYHSMDDFIKTRVTKENQMTNYSVEQNEFLGFGDGNRFNIYSTIIDDYLHSNILLGLDLNYTNEYNVGAHNIVVFFLSIFGIFGIIYLLTFTKSFLRYTHHLNNRKQKQIMYFLILTCFFNFMVGESHGNIILISFVFFSIIIINKGIFYSTYNTKIETN